ncbi:MAG TPA: group 1 truncated hemoglobin [Acidimicrobiales bacterium]|nr:group 1 truncated hemoglobin [Acidimicrobiales bacterium]
MEQSTLFERLGGRDGVRTLSEAIVANHFANPLISTRYANASKGQAELVDGVTEFFCTGLTGVPTYEGPEVPVVHTGMNIDETEFVAVLDDALAAMRSLGIGEQEQGEVLAILYSMKGDVVRL